MSVQNTAHKLFLKVTFWLKVPERLFEVPKLLESLEKIAILTTGAHVFLILSFCHP